MINMALCPKKRKTKTGKIYYELWEVKWVNGKVVSKYVGYLGKSPKTKQELTPEQLLPYVNKIKLIKETVKKDMNGTLSNEFLDSASNRLAILVLVALAAAAAYFVLVLWGPD